MRCSYNHLAYSILKFGTVTFAQQFWVQTVQICKQVRFLLVSIKFDFRLSNILEIPQILLILIFISHHHSIWSINSLERFSYRDFHRTPSKTLLLQYCLIFYFLLVVSLKLTYTFVQKHCISIIALLLL